MSRYRCKALVGSVAVVLAGCATPRATQMTLPNGKQGFSVRCDGARSDWQDCYQQAGETCPRGYEIAAKEGNEIVHGASGNGWGNTATKVTRMLLVECR